MRHYIGLIHKDADSDYGVSFPDLPGCITAGATLDEARAMAEEALKIHLEGMVEDGDPVPEPSTLEAVMADPVNRDGVAILVASPAASSRVIRVNVTFPENLLAAIDAHAGAHGLTRSRFLAEAALQAIATTGREKTDALSHQAAVDA